MLWAGDVASWLVPSAVDYSKRCHGSLEAAEDRALPSKNDRAPVHLMSFSS